MQNVFNLLREKLKEESVKTIPTCEKDGYSMTEEESMIFENDAIEIVNRVEEVHKQELDDSVYRGKLFAVEEMLDKHATEYEMKFLAKIFAKLELSGKLKEEQFSTLLHEIIRLAILADEHIIK